VLTQPLSLILIETDDPKAAYAARRLRGAALMPDAVFDEIDGVLAIVCGATKADKLLQTVTSFAKREFNCVYRGVLSRTSIVFSRDPLTIRDAQTRALGSATDWSARTRHRAK
jgi:hypothetical protein